MSQLTLKIFVHGGGRAPQKGKMGDAGLDVFARFHPSMMTGEPGSVDVNFQEMVKVPLGFSYAFWVDGSVSHDYWLDIRNRSGVGTKSGFVTVAEVGDSNYRGEIHYCAAKVTSGFYTVRHGDKIAQALINPFVDPCKVQLLVVDTIEELGPSVRGTDGFGSSGT